jgi:hypothetical protein
LTVVVGAAVVVGATVVVGEVVVAVAQEVNTIDRTSIRPITIQAVFFFIFLPSH